MKKIEFKIVEMEKDDFDYKQTLLDHLNSNDWAAAHPIKTVEDVDVAFKVSAVLKGDDDKVTVEDETANYLCDLAESQLFRPGAGSEALEAIRDFKTYFIEVKKSKSEKPEKK